MIRRTPVSTLFPYTTLFRSIAATSGNALEVNTNKFTVIGSSGDTTIGGILNVTGATTLSNIATGVVHSTSGLLTSSQIVNGGAHVCTAIAHSTRMLSYSFLK